MILALSLALGVWSLQVDENYCVRVTNAWVTCVNGVIPVGRPSLCLASASVPGEAAPRPYRAASVQQNKLAYGFIN